MQPFTFTRRYQSLPHTKKVFIVFYFTFRLCIVGMHLLVNALCEQGQTSHQAAQQGSIATVLFIT